MLARNIEEEAFLALLCCPLCAQRPALRYDRETETFSCEAKGHRFPRIDGFPALRPEDVILPSPQKEV